MLGPPRVSPVFGQQPSVTREHSSTCATKMRRRWTTAQLMERHQTRAYEEAPEELRWRVLDDYCSTASRTETHEWSFGNVQVEAMCPLGLAPVQSSCAAIAQRYSRASGWILARQCGAATVNGRTGAMRFGWQFRRVRSPRR